MISADDRLTGSGQTLYSVTEACQRLRISRWMFYRLVQNRELRTITIGRRRLITAGDLDAYIRRLQEVAS